MIATAYMPNRNRTNRLGASSGLPTVSRRAGLVWVCSFAGARFADGSRRDNLMMMRRLAGRFMVLILRVEEKPLWVHSRARRNYTPEANRRRILFLARTRQGRRSPAA